MPPLRERVEDIPLLEDATPEKLEEALKRSGGSRLEAARLLGISRSSLYRILRRMPPADAPAQG